MIRIDQKILNLTQRFSDWVQSLFGITSFDIAKYFIIPTIVLLQITDDVLDIINGKSTTFLMTVWALSVAYLVPKQINKIKNLVISNPTSRNPLEIILIGPRCQLLIFLPMFTFFFLSIVKLEIGVLITLVNTFLLLFNLYLMCCTPKPPSKSKIKKAIEKIKSVRISLPQASPSLSPG